VAEKDLEQRHATKRTLEELQQEAILAPLRRRLVGWQPVTAGAKMNQRYGYFNRALVANPLDWLQARLGPVADYVEEGPEFGAGLIHE
jgi:hypothetical protein